MSKKKNSTNQNRIFGFISFVLILALIAGTAAAILTKGFTERDPYYLFSKEPSSTDSTGNNNVQIPDDNKPDLPSNPDDQSPNTPVNPPDDQTPTTPVTPPDDTQQPSEQGKYVSLNGKTEGNLLYLNIDKSVYLDLWDYMTNHNATNGIICAMKSDSGEHVFIMSQISAVDLVVSVIYYQGEGWAPLCMSSSWNNTLVSFDQYVADDGCIVLPENLLPTSKLKVISAESAIEEIEELKDPSVIVIDSQIANRILSNNAFA